MLNPKANRINFITRLSGNLNALNFTKSYYYYFNFKKNNKNTGERNIYVAGSNGTTYGFSLETHEIIDI